MERAASVEEEPRVANQRANSIPVFFFFFFVVGERRGRREVQQAKTKRRCCFSIFETGKRLQLSLSLARTNNEPALEHGYGPRLPVRGVGLGSVIVELVRRRGVGVGRRQSRSDHFAALPPPTDLQRS